MLAMLLVFSGAPGAHAQDVRQPRISLSVRATGQIVTGGEPIYAIVPPESAGVEFAFRPEADGDVLVAPIILGTDPGHMEPANGPDCDGRCEKRVFSVDLGKPLGKREEGWGRLTARDVGTGEEAAARVYWDPTPPIAKFESPGFNARVDGTRPLQIVAHTSDEDVVSIRVTWTPAPPGARSIPAFEQHDLGYDFARHAACVPTAIAAGLKWLQNTGQADILVPPFDSNNRKLVEALGALMQTDSSGTSGSGLIAGLRAFLLITKGFVDGQDYDIDVVRPPRDSGGITLGDVLSNDLPLEDADGIPPYEVAARFNAGGAVIVGFHNLAGNDTFGHYLVLADVSLNSSGTAWLTVMDPHVEQPWPSPYPITEGAFRRFLLLKNGQVKWTDAGPGYYFPYSERVKLDHMVILGDFQSADPGVAGGLSIEGNAPVTGGEVPGVLTQGGRTFVGRFTPPPGATGPWLLTSETTHRAGHTMRSYRYVGGPEASSPAP